MAQASAGIWDNGPALQIRLTGGALQDALSKIQRAYRDLTLDPALKELLKGPQAGKRGGTVPAYYNSQLANYQAGLARLNSGPSGQASLFL